MKARFSDEIFAEDSPNPMDGVANLADVMLVFACGLMLALVIHFNVDLGTQTAQPPNANETQQEVTIPNGEGEAIDPDKQLQNYGTVYRDPDTGKLYIIENGEGN